MPIDAMDFPILREYCERARAEGRLEGVTGLLTDLLASRFGPLPGWAVERLRKASPEQLLRWSKSIVRAASLDDLLRQD